MRKDKKDPVTEKQNFYNKNNFNHNIDYNASLIIRLNNNIGGLHNLD